MYFIKEKNNSTLAVCDQRQHYSITCLSFKWALWG